jgi:ubiquinone/menaquinone biosynthesis methyltransferase
MPSPLPRLRDAFASRLTRQTYVRRLFSVIAPRYDLITVLLSFGRDRRWKRRLVSLAPPNGGRVLDAACGTGDIAFEAAARGGRVVALDVTAGMLVLARQRAAASHTPVSFVCGDMVALPFPDASFGIVTTGYGLRNAPDLAAALAEIRRVLAPGGCLLSLDFNRPSNRLVRAVYLAYLTVVGSVLGMLLHRDPDTYRYIPESIRHYPGAAAVCDLARDVGFDHCVWHPVLGGLLAMHVARTPEGRPTLLPSAGVSGPRGVPA